MSTENKAVQSDGNGLTREQEKLIRGYVLKLIGPTSILFIVATFLVPWVIKEIAIKNAINDAFRVAFQPITQMAVEVVRAKDRADAATNEINQSALKLSLIHI